MKGLLDEKIIKQKFRDEISDKILNQWHAEVMISAQKMSKQALSNDGNYIQRRKRKYLIF